MSLNWPTCSVAPTVYFLACLLCSEIKVFACFVSIGTRSARLTALDSERRRTIDRTIGEWGPGVISLNECSELVSPGMSRQRCSACGM